MGLQVRMIFLIYVGNSPPKAKAKQEEGSTLYIHKDTPLKKQGSVLQ